jgi:hypothetical protein
MAAAQDAFLNLLVAAMMDAAVEKKLTQLKTTISPDGKTVKTVRLIVIPEEMDYDFPQPLGEEPKVKDGQHRHGKVV